MIAPVTPQMTDLRLFPILATLDEQPVDVIRYDAHHSVDTPIATGSVTVGLPLPDHLRGDDPGLILNRRVSLQAGYRESITRQVFNGFIRSDRMQLSRDGNYATLMLAGYGRLLNWPSRNDLVFPANTPLDEIARSLCAMRGVPQYRIDRVLAPDGTRIRLGGNPDIDDGQVIIPRRTSPLDWVTRVLRLFGYRAFDAPQEFRVQRVSGIPSIGPMETYKEGSLAHSLQRDRDIDQMVTAWTVEGPTYTDSDGVQIPVVSIPDGLIPFEPLLDPPGYREGSIRDNILVRDDLAHVVRQIQEIDQASLASTWNINARGNSFFYPGGTIRAGSTTMDAPEHNYWLMSMRHSLDMSQGFKQHLTAWRGGGVALPNADDLQTINVRSAAVHLGDERVPWYAMPDPAGTSFPIDITVPDTFTSLAISLYAHGTNSHMLDGHNHESTVSKIEVWQGGEMIGSTDLPVIDEEYALQLPYGSGLTHWQHVRMPVPGRLKEGPAEIRIVCGEHKSLPWALRHDDFEVRNIVLELRGTGAPELPGGV